VRNIVANVGILRADLRNFVLIICWFPTYCSLPSSSEPKSKMECLLSSETECCAGYQKIHVLFSSYEHLWFYNAILSTRYGPILHLHLLRTLW